MSLKVIKFSAQWCGPCRAMKPAWEEAKARITDVDFEECDIDENPTLASQYRIMSVPTLLFLKDGNVVESLIGLNSFGMIKQSVDRNNG